MEIKEEQMGTILECQMCENNDCHFTQCSDSLSGSIFCKSISNTSSTGNKDTGKSPLTTDTQQMSSYLIMSYTREHCGFILWKFYFVRSWI